MKQIDGTQLKDVSALFILIMESMASPQDRIIPDEIPGQVSVEKDYQIEIVLPQPMIFGMNDINMIRGMIRHYSLVLASKPGIQNLVLQVSRKLPNPAR